MKQVEISPQRSANLGKLLYKDLCHADIRVPKLDETEPKYTGSVLAPVIRKRLEILNTLRLQFRGDGGDSQSFPASALNISFFPDLAVSLGKQHLWAAEVKVLRRNNRQNAIATALGQATLYKSRYEHVVVILIDTVPTDHTYQRKLIEDSREMDLNVVIRSRVGNYLLPQNV